MNFSTRIQYLLPSGIPNSDIEDLIVERLKELHDRVRTTTDRSLQAGINILPNEFTFCEGIVSAFLVNKAEFQVSQSKI